MINQQYLQKLAPVLREGGLDGILIAPSEELGFLLGHSPHLCERFQGLVLGSDGSRFYICNLLTVDEMREALGPDAEIIGWFDGDGFADTAARIFRERGLQKIGVGSSVRAFNILEIAGRDPGLRFVNGKPVLEELRIRKTPEELENLRQAARMADAVYDKLLGYIRPGLTEEDIRGRISAWFQEMGGGSWEAIVASGPNAALPHYGGGNRTIGEKDVVIVDYGCVWNGMYSDMTRTLFVGEPTEEERKVYGIVRAANEAAERAAVEGAWIPDVDQAARGLIEEAGYGRYFTTRLGHGIGYSVHEAPDIKAANRRALEKNMAFSIEPGIYLPGRFGVRVEDIVAITDNGTEVLNQSGKELTVL